MLERNGSTAQIKLALQKIVVEYFSNSPLDFAPIHHKIAGLLALLRIAKI
jgi:hypothetical protein